MGGLSFYGPDGLRVQAVVLVRSDYLWACFARRGAAGGSLPYGQGALKVTRRGAITRPVAYARDGTELAAAGIDLTTLNSGP